MACCVFFAPRMGYRPLTKDDEGEYPAGSVTVVAGKEKRVFVVDSFVLEKGPFRVLLEKVRMDMKILKNRGGGRVVQERVIFVDVDAIFFEHMLWLMYNDCSSLHQLNLEEILDFYAQET